MSRVLIRPQLNYFTTEKECLVVLYAVKQFRPCIYGRKYTTMSDNNPIRRIDSVKDPGQRLIRWRIKLSDYEHEFKYKPGKSNTNADALLRNTIQKYSDDEIREANQPARLLTMLTREVKRSEENTSKPISKTSESESKSKLTIQTRKGFTSRITPSKPSTSKPHKPISHDGKTGQDPQKRRVHYPATIKWRNKNLKLLNKI